MTNNKLNYSQIFIILSMCSMVACNATDKSEKNVKKVSVQEKENVIVDSSDSLENEPSSINKKEDDNFEVIVVQCANGYEYAMHNYNFNPVVELELDKFENIKVKPFPYKALMGVTYQGVFDKKYCPPIIQKVDVDFLILTRFDRSNDAFLIDSTRWGYEVKIVNTKTMEQTKSIHAHDLKEYVEIEKHIKDNIGKLKADMERLK